MRKSFLAFGSPRIEKDEIEEMLDSVRTGWLSTGPKVFRFEEAFKKYSDSPYAVALHSCTAGLYLGLTAAGVEEGDEVITSPFTFAATANVIVHRRAKPVFVDVDPRTMNLDVRRIESRITRRTKAIVPVHFAGRPCPMRDVRSIAKKHGLYVIQDAAHSLEAMHSGHRISRWGDLTAYSFYVTKNLCTGEGGMITTSHPRWAETIRILASHGMTKNAWSRYSNSGFKHYQVILPGFKFNMMDIQAAMGLRQLEKVERYLKIREGIWRRYDEAFSELPFELPAAVEPGDRHARHLYTVVLKPGAFKADRDRWIGELGRRRIGTGVHFISVHLQPYYRKAFGYRAKDFPNAAGLSERILSLPLSAGMADSDVNDVIDAVRRLAFKFRR